MMEKEKHNPVVKNRARRMMLRALLLFIGLTASLAGCRSHDSQADKRLLAAEAVMHSHPDSALHLLQTIPHPEKLKGLAQGLYALLRTQAAFKNYLPVTSDSLITIAVDYFSQTPDSLRKAWSCFYAGQVYRDLKDFPKAIHYYHQAASAGENIEDYKFLDLLYYHWGLLIYQDKPYEEGLEKLMKAKAYAKKANDATTEFYILAEIAWSYVWMKDYSNSIQCIKEAINIAENLGKTDLSWLYYRLGVLYLANKHYSEGVEAVNDGISYIMPEETDLLNDLNLLKGDHFYELHSYDSARIYYAKGMDEQSYYSIANYHLSMTRIEKQFGNFKQALFHREQYSAYVDSIKRKEENERVIELQKKYDMTKMKYENMKLKEANLYRDLTILIVFLLFVCFTIIIYFKKKKEKEVIIQSKSRLLTQSMLQLQQKTNELLQTEQNIHEKEKELSIYKSQLQTMKLQILKMTEVTKKIEKLSKLNHLQKNKSKTDLLLSIQDKADLFEAINFCFDGFETRLRSQYPKLTDEDILLCCLLKMDINNQDIAILLESSDEALKKRKYRIKHDKIADMENTSLADFLMNY